MILLDKSLVSIRHYYMTSGRERNEDFILERKKNGTGRVDCFNLVSITSIYIYINSYII